MSDRAVFPKPLATERSVTGMPTGRLATWWVIASEIVIFGGLIVSYLCFRFHHPHWSDEAAHTNTVAGAFNTFVLLSSSLCIVLAHQAAGRQNTRRAYKFIWLTILGGAIFMCVKAVEYTQEISHGFTIGRDLFWSFYYTATGLHGLHVLAGMIIMGIIASDVKRGQNLQRVEYIGLYWHFVDIV